MNILFVCLAGRNRSVLAAKVYSYLANKKGKKVKTLAAGICADPDRIQVNEELIKKADKIFVMEKYIKDVLKDSYKVSEDKIIVLDIEDIYNIENGKDRIELMKVLEKKLRKFI